MNGTTNKDRTMYLPGPIAKPPPPPKVDMTERRRPPNAG